MDWNKGRMKNLTLDYNLAKINERIKSACTRSNRALNDVKVIAVTKYVDIEQTRKVLDLGLIHIGENRANEGIEKFNELHDRGEWHFIGNLQTRKVKQIIGKFDYIHSLDRLSLAEEIDKRAKEIGIIANCFIQVNVSGEVTKSGVSSQDVLHFIKEVSQFKSIKIVGLMTMAPHFEDNELTRPIFRELRELKDMVNEQKVLDYSLDELSMGMSNDFEIAVEEGATFVRLGSILWN